MVEKKDFLSIELRPSDEVFSTEVRIKVASEDMKRIIGYRGKLYRAIKVILKYALQKESLQVVVDIWDKNSN